MRIRHICLMIVLALFGSQAEGAEPDSKPQFKVPSQWAGQWEISPEANALLGYAAKQDRVNSNYAHPTSFTLSFDKSIGERMDAETLNGYRDDVFPQTGQRIVATGQWKTLYGDEPGLSSDCFLTIKDGATYLWVPAKWIMVYGGQVSFLQGANEDRDLLVINFNPHETRFRRDDTVAFQRKGSRTDLDK